MLTEQLLLRCLAFDTVIPADPQVLLLNTLRLVRPSRSLGELAVALLNDCTLSDAYPALPARALVAAAIRLAAEMLGMPTPHGWWDALEVQPCAASAACHAMLDAYDPGARSCVAIEEGDPPIQPAVGSSRACGTA